MGGCPEPLVGGDEALLQPLQRAADGETVEGGQEQHVHQGGRGHLGSAPRELLGDLEPGERSVGEHRLDIGDGSSRLRGWEPFFRQAPRARLSRRRRGQPVEPPQVVPADEMERPPHQPRDHHIAIFDRAMHVGYAESAGAGAHGQPGRPQVLRLHGEQAAGDVLGCPAGAPGQHLRGQPQPSQPALRHAHP